MDLSQKTIITGGAGFIGARLCNFLLTKGIAPQDLLIFDEGAKYNSRKCTLPLRKAGVECIEFEKLSEYLAQSPAQPKVFYHMGAISNTEEKDVQKLDKQNVEYSKMIWEYSIQKEVPFYYASSASTYGDGSLGFNDDHSLFSKLKPLNFYAQSKQSFDLFVLEELTKNRSPKNWAGFKFFNVYGPGEDHKGSQGSVIWPAKKQILESGVVKLFQSHNPAYKDGEQKRDFVYVGDLCKVLNFFYESKSQNGIYNLGTGQARTFKDLVMAVSKALNKEVKIEYIPTPESLRAQYQYFTEATLSKLRAAGYKEPMTDLNEGVRLSIREDEELSTTHL